MKPFEKVIRRFILIRIKYEDVDNNIIQSDNNIF
jgi:hypothetical protein